MITYSEKLKDPRWQRKRLEVLSAADFACELCGATDKQLQVHHLKYSGDPWDATLADLESLCETCHQNRTDETPLLVISCNGVRASEIAKVQKALFLAACNETTEGFIHAVAAFAARVREDGVKSTINILAQGNQ
jgi:hypothetical protein